MTNAIAEGASVCVADVSADQGEQTAAECREAFFQQVDVADSASVEAMYAAAAERYGVLVEKERDGKRYLGIERSTFVIDAEGNVAKVMRRVDPQTHADDVLAALP